MSWGKQNGSVASCKPVTRWRSGRLAIVLPRQSTRFILHFQSIPANPSTSPLCAGCEETAPPPRGGSSFPRCARPLCSGPALLQQCKQPPCDKCVRSRYPDSATANTQPASIGSHFNAWSHWSVCLLRWTPNPAFEWWSWRDVLAAGTPSPFHRSTVRSGRCSQVNQARQELPKRKAVFQRSVWRWELPERLGLLYRLGHVEVWPLAIDLAREDSDLTLETFGESRIAGHDNADPEAICFDHLEFVWVGESPNHRCRLTRVEADVFLKLQPWQLRLRLPICTREHKLARGFSIPRGLRDSSGSALTELHAPQWCHKATMPESGAESWPPRNHRRPPWAPSS